MVWFVHDLFPVSHLFSAAPKEPVRPREAGVRQLRLLPTRRWSSSCKSRPNASGVSVPRMASLTTEPVPSEVECFNGAARYPGAGNLDPLRLDGSYIQPMRSVVFASDQNSVPNFERSCSYSYCSCGYEVTAPPSWIFALQQGGTPRISHLEQSRAGIYETVGVFTRVIPSHQTDQRCKIGLGALPGEFLPALLHLPNQRSSSGTALIKTMIRYTASV